MYKEGFECLDTQYVRPMAIKSPTIFSVSITQDGLVDRSFTENIRKNIIRNLLLLKQLNHEYTNFRDVAYYHDRYKVDFIDEDDISRTNEDGIIYKDRYHEMFKKGACSGNDLDFNHDNLDVAFIHKRQTPYCHFIPFRIIRNKDDLFVVTMNSHYGNLSGPKDGNDGFRKLFQKIYKIKGINSVKFINIEPPVYQFGNYGCLIFSLNCLEILKSIDLNQIFLVDFTRNTQSTEVFAFDERNQILQKVRPYEIQYNKKTNLYTTYFFDPSRFIDIPSYLSDIATDELLFLPPKFPPVLEELGNVLNVLSDKRFSIEGAIRVYEEYFQNNIDFCNAEEQYNFITRRLYKMNFEVKCNNDDAIVMLKKLDQVLNEDFFSCSRNMQTEAVCETSQPLKKFEENFFRVLHRKVYLTLLERGVKFSAAEMEKHKKLLQPFCQTI